MKRLLMLLSVLLLVFFVVVDVVAVARTRGYRTPSRQRGSGYGAVRRPMRRIDPNSLISLPEFLSDSNAIKAQVKAFEGLDKALEKVDTQSRDETRQWMRGPVEEGMKLAQAVQEQVVEELTLVRELAVKDGAKKTVAAIDALMLERHQRYGMMLTRMERERRKMLYGEQGRGDRYDERDAGRRGMYDERDRYGDRGRYGDRDTYRRPERYYDRGRYESREGYGRRDRDRDPNSQDDRVTR